MDKCIICGKPVSHYPGYVTDGKIAICNDCAAANSLARIITHIENEGEPANLKSVFSAPVIVEGGLVNQTDASDNPAVIDHRDIDGEQYKHGSPYMKEVKEYLESGINQNKLVELDKGKLDAIHERNEKYGTEGEEAARDFFSPLKPVGVMGDIENMSQDDFYSKYADNPAALNMWHDYHGEPDEFLEV